MFRSIPTLADVRSFAALFSARMTCSLQRATIEVQTKRIAQLSRTLEHAQAECTALSRGTALDSWKADCKRLQRERDDRAKEIYSARKALRIRETQEPLVDACARIFAELEAGRVEVDLAEQRHGDEIEEHVEAMRQRGNEIERLALELRNAHEERSKLLEQIGTITRVGTDSILGNVMRERDGLRSELVIERAKVAELRTNPMHVVHSPAGMQETVAELEATRQERDKVARDRDASLRDAYVLRNELAGSRERVLELEQELAAARHTATADATKRDELAGIVGNGAG